MSANRPGELAHMDLKSMDLKRKGWIPNGGGWQTGSTATAKKALSVTTYVHSLVDDPSRLAYPNTPRRGAHLCRLPATGHPQYLADDGINRIEGVITDHHWSYRRSEDIAA